MLIVVSTPIVLVLRSPLEDPLSAKHGIPTKRRVQAFVLLAIAVFVAGGIAANRYVTAAHLSPPAAPPTDAVVAPSPESSVVRPATPNLETSPTLVAKSLPRRPSHPAPSKAASRPVTVSSGLASIEELAVRLTNAQRAQHGCSALRVDSRLRTAARGHSKDMHVRHYFEHDSLDGTSPWDRIKATGYTSPGAENIAMGYATAQAVVDGWMKSPGHRANILNCSLKAVGIGAEYGRGGPWWTQDFGFK